MKPGSFISKEESKLLQGIAVCLMVFLHLFAFPERIHTSYVAVLNLGPFNFETLIAYFGRICVSMFAFNTGYGMCKSTSNLQQYHALAGYKSVLLRLWGLMQRFWLVFVLFIPVGYLMGRYNDSIGAVIRSLLGMNYSFNEEWWYLGAYIDFLLVFPLITMLRKQLCNFRIWQTLLWATILSVAIIVFRVDLSQHFFSFMLGMFFASVPIYEWLHKKLFNCKILHFAVCLLILGAVFVAKTWILPVNYDYVLVPFLFFSLTGLMKHAWVYKAFSFVFKFPAQYSTYIWLTHSFFCYYLFQKITFFPKYSPLIFLWCMILSIVSGWILENALQLVHKGTRKLKERVKK